MYDFDGIQVCHSLDFGNGMNSVEGPAHKGMPKKSIIGYPMNNSALTGSDHKGVKVGNMVAKEQEGRFLIFQKLPVFNFYSKPSVIYYIDKDQVEENALQDEIDLKLAGQMDGSVVLRADQSVPIQYVVNVIDAVNNINELYKTKHKVILATKPSR
jgi:hypothetical protein